MLEVADILRAAGPAYRATQARHLSLQQLKAMSAIEHCRTAALGGHVEACADCGHQRIAYNSCRNRHCPKCQGATAPTWLAEREADLLPVGYFHVVFTLPVEIASRRRSHGTAIRCAAAVPLLRWADDRHRILRPLGPASGASSHPTLSREGLSVTRHGLNHACAAAIALQRSADVASVLVGYAPMLVVRHHCSAQNRHTVHRHGNKTGRPTCRGDRRSRSRINHKLKSP